MLSKNERNIFRLAKESKENKIQYEVAVNVLKISFDDVKSACSGLISKGLAQEKYYAPTTKSWIPWGIVLTEKGRHRFRYTLETLGSFILKSIFVPLVVSFLTTLLTLWLTGVFTE